ncbi:MAG: PEP-CTERM sorting domain-containing protein [Planctomycetota bacterium]
MTELPGVTFTPGAPILASDWDGRSLDFGELEGDFGGGFDVVDIENCVVTAIVPEPATVSLLALGGLGLIRRRRNG